MPYCLLTSQQSIFYQISHPHNPSKGILVFLNGIGMTASMWAPITQSFRDDYTVLTWDFLGQKMSDKFEDHQEASFSDQSNHLNYLLDFLQLGPVHLIGTSYGAETGLYFAATFPQKTKSLTTITATGEITALQRIICANWISACERGLQGLLQEMLPWNYSQSYLESHGAELTARWSTLPRVPDELTRSFQKLAQSFLQLDCRPIASRINCPTLIIAAENDLLKPVHCSKSLQQHLINSQLEIISECGHAAVVEKPQAVVRLIQNFFSQLT